MTIPQLLVRRVEEHGPRAAIHVKRAGKFQAVSWQQLACDVARLGEALLAAGVRPGDRVVQISENRYEWIVCDLAIQFAGAVHVPLHATLAAAQAAQQINHCEARVVLLSGPEQAAKLADCAGQLTSVERYISFDRCTSLIGGTSVEHLDQFTAASTGHWQSFSRRAAAAASADSLATILYTSGTTGQPKGVMLTQRNLVSNALAALEAFEQRAEDVRLTFLPLSHIFARTCDMYTWIAGGCELALAESRQTVLDDCRQVRPTLLNGVPYFFDKVRRVLIEQGQADQPDVLRELLGGRMRFCCSGGAALPDHVFDFWHQRGVPILQGYGLTESSPVVTASTPQRNRKGCVGPPIAGVEVRIASDGEILTRGPHVMLGYYKDPAATAEAIRDGWLHTGDIGQLDDDGFLKITGRKKEIIVTSGGKNVVPVMLESLLTEDPLILQAMVVGDGRDYLAALIVPDLDQLAAEAAKQGLAIDDVTQLPALPEVHQWYRRRIEQRLACVSHYEQVRQFTLLARPFQIERGELTPKLSLRRQQIAAHFAAEIEAMYRR